MSNLVAYIPVLNQRHLDWFEKHPNSHLFLISQEMAEQMIQRLSRNMGAVPTEVMLNSIRANGLVSSVGTFDPENWDPRLALPDHYLGAGMNDFILPDEDISHEVAKKYLGPVGIRFQFEVIWSRWDMTAVKMMQPVIPDCEVSREQIDIFRTEEANSVSQKSPDWWRQIGAMAFRGSELVACGWNEHFPTEYEAYVFGDTRLNFNAGDPSGMEAYLSLHAEEYLISFCAKNGIALQGASLYINTFPCGRCARAVATAGFNKLFFREGSSFLKGFEILREAGIRIVQVRND